MLLKRSQLAYAGYEQLGRVASAPTVFVRRVICGLRAAVVIRSVAALSQ